MSRFKEFISVTLLAIALMLCILVIIGTGILPIILAVYINPLWLLLYIGVVYLVYLEILIFSFIIALFI